MERCYRCPALEWQQYLLLANHSSWAPRELPLLSRTRVGTKMGSWGSCSSHCPGLPFPNTSSDPQATPLPAALFSHAKTGHELVSSCPPFLCSETNLAAYLIFSPLAGPIWIPASTNRSYWYCRAPTVSLRGKAASDVRGTGWFNTTAWGVGPVPC